MRLNESVNSELREEFPIFSALGKAAPLAYLDTAASSQKPRVVIDRMARYFREEHANVRRGAYRLSSTASDNVERVRQQIAGLIGAGASSSIVFTKGTTDGINLVARAIERHFSSKDSILLTELEHHSNIVPWQLLAERSGITVNFVKLRGGPEINLNDLEDSLKEYRPKLLSITALANAFGSLTDIRAVMALAKAYDCWVLLDAAQLVAHYQVNVAELGCDFLVFSGHKMYGPTGVGVLYVRPEMYEFMEPVDGGGDMIERVTIEGSTWAPPPHKFEAGTPAIAEIIGLGSAVEFVNSIGIDRISEQIGVVFEYGKKVLQAEPGVTIYAPREASSHRSIIAFNVEGCHPHDIASIADAHNVQVRAGHHCAMPALASLNLNATVRASVGVYSKGSDFDQLLEALREAKRIFGVKT